jgi:hypothetical protein
MVCPVAPSLQPADPGMWFRKKERLENQPLELTT